MATNFLKSFTEQFRRGGSVDAERATFWQTPWLWKTADGVIVGRNKQFWLYRELDLRPYRWEDDPIRWDAGERLRRLLAELGRTSKDLGKGMKRLAKNREIHLLSITWETDARYPDTTPDALAGFLDQVMNFLVPARSVVIGVRLWPASMSDLEGRSPLEMLKTEFASIAGESVPDLSAVQSDRDLIASIMDRNGAGSAPSPETWAQLESWWNWGRGMDVEVYEAKDHIVIDETDKLEFAAISNFEEHTLMAPRSPWLLDASAHPEGPLAVSIRAELQPNSVSRNEVRQGRRKLLANKEEVDATGDIEREEDYMALDQSERVSSYLAAIGEPTLKDVSIVFGRRVSVDANETYIDELATSYGILALPLVHRQMDALDEMLPASDRRVNPFLQDLTISMIAHAGLTGYSVLGDGEGVFCGLVDPDATPYLLDPRGAPRRNLPASMLVAGDSGGGKTFFCQLIALQAALAGEQVIFVNPKGDDSLAPFANAVGGDVVPLSQIEGQPGYFDPFRFCTDPKEAADIATSHILSVLGSTGVAGYGFTAEQELILGAGLEAGAEAGARCVWEALQYVHDEQVKELIRHQMTNPLFRLGIATEPLPQFSTSKRLTLIEFDRPLDFPEKGTSPSEYSRTQRVSLAAMRLITRASLNILKNAKGGVLIVDEAWVFLNNNEGLAALQAAGRLGRSRGVLSIMATQRVTDVVRDGVDMESYLSRVFVMKLTDPKDATAALQLCGLEPTQERIEMLRNFGAAPPRNGQPARPSRALARDLTGGHSLMMVGPIPEQIRVLLSTNPDDRPKQESAGRAIRAYLQSDATAERSLTDGLVEDEALTVFTPPASPHAAPAAPAAPVTTPSPVQAPPVVPAATAAQPVSNPTPPAAPTPTTPPGPSSTPEPPVPSAGPAAASPPETAAVETTAPETPAPFNPFTVQGVPVPTSDESSLVTPPVGSQPFNPFSAASPDEPAASAHPEPALPEPAPTPAPAEPEVPSMPFSLFPDTPDAPERHDGASDGDGDQPPSSGWVQI